MKLRLALAAVAATTMATASASADAPNIGNIPMPPEADCVEHLLPIGTLVTTDPTDTSHSEPEFGHSFNHAEQNHLFQVTISHPVNGMHGENYTSQTTVMYHRSAVEGSSAGFISAINTATVNGLVLSASYQDAVQPTPIGLSSGDQYVASATAYLTASRIINFCREQAGLDPLATIAP